MTDEWTDDRPPRCDAWNQTNKRQYSSGRCMRAGFFRIRDSAVHAGKLYCSQHRTMALRGNPLCRVLWGDRDVVRYKGRDVIVWTMPDGEQQPFYRSTGRNSGQKGTWFPFDGYRNRWFIKDRFTHPYTDLGLYRFGHQKYKDVSGELGKMKILEGRIVKTGEEVNAFIEQQKKSQQAGR